jgi:hypothetical protein
MLSKTYTTRYLWRIDAHVVSLVRETMVNLENGGLRLEGEEMKALEARECRCSLWIAHGAREPAHA